MPCDPFERVSKELPCPICGKGDWCLVARDRTAAICGRIEQGAVKHIDNSGWLHRLEQTCQAPVLPKRQPVLPRREVVLISSGPAPNHFQSLAQRLAQQAGSFREELANVLGVSVFSLEALGVGYDVQDRFWSFPERDANGKIIGISARYWDGSKIRVRRSKSGLTYSGAWEFENGPLLLPEGGSDTAALITMGISAVGRPSNNGGVALLSEMLRAVPYEREIIVLGELDQKPDGRWPGKEGAVRTAQKLVEALDRPVSWALPPDGAKDARAWLQAMQAVPRHRLADLFLSGLQITTQQPPPCRPVPVDHRPVVNLDEWRDQVLATRIRLLKTPGCYLDTSPTGSGKSSVDLQVILHALQGGFP